MAPRTVTPPVGHGRELRQPTGPREPHPKTGRPPRTRVIADVRLTKTDLGYTAQGLTFEKVDAEPPYWTTDVDGTPWDGRSLTRLVKALVAGDELDADATVEVQS